MRYRLLGTLLMVGAFVFMTSDVEAGRWSRKKNQKQESHDSDVGKGPGHGKKAHEMPMAYSAPARINCTGNWDVFLSGSFIYWHASQGGMDVASFFDGTVSPINSGKVFQRFKYKPGFKVALGTNFGHDNWTGMVEYTRLHFSTTVRSSAPQNPLGTLLTTSWTLSQPNIGPGDQLDRIKSKWECDLDVLDGELTRWYYSGRMLTFGPFAGARGGWLDQRMTVNSAPVGSTEFFPIVFKSDSWFIGPRGGMDLNWMLGYGFRFTTSMAASLLYQRLRVRFRGVGPSGDVALSRATYRQVTPNAEFGLGLAWGTYFMNRSWHFDLAAAYEFHYFWNQNAMRTLTDSFFTTYNKPGDLMYHGLTLTARFDF